MARKRISADDPRTAREYARARRNSLFGPAEIAVGFSNHPNGEWQLFLSLYGRELAFIVAYATREQAVAAQALALERIKARDFYLQASVAAMVAALEALPGAHPPAEMPEDRVEEIFAAIRGRKAVTHAA